MKQQNGDRDDVSGLRRENDLLRNRLAAMQAQIDELTQSQSKQKNKFQNTSHTKKQQQPSRWKKPNSHPRSKSPAPDEVGIRHKEIVMMSAVELSDVQVRADAPGLHHRHPAHQDLHNPIPSPSRAKAPIKAKISDADLIELGLDVDSESESFLSSTSTNDLNEAGDQPAGFGSRTFTAALLDRAGWLCGLLILQSGSSFILRGYHELLQSHPVLVEFLTCLVGSGGNAGNQASVRVIRGLAIGAITAENRKGYLVKELRMGLCLSFVLAIAGCIRAAVFLVPFAETLAITLCLFVIVMTSVALGAVLPLIMQRIGVDPAHSSTTIQVVMDILGVSITVLVSSFILDSALGTLSRQVSSP